MDDKPVFRMPGLLAIAVTALMWLFLSYAFIG